MVSWLLWEEQRAAKPCADSGSASARNGAGLRQVQEQGVWPMWPAGHCVQKGPVLVLILRCPLLGSLNNCWTRGAHIFNPQTMQPVLVKSEEPDLREARGMYKGHRDPPGAVGISVRDFASQATVRTSLSPSLGLQWSLLPELVASPTESSLLREKHHVTAQEVYTGSALTPDLLCAGSRLPSSGIPALGHLCKLHTQTCLPASSSRAHFRHPELLSSWPLPWFAGSWAAFFF